MSFPNSGASIVAMIKTFLRLSVSLFVLVLILGIVVWLGLRAFAFYYQSRGGELLVQAQKIETGDSADVWNLSLTPQSSAQARDQATQAVADLQESLWYNSSDSQSYLLLGNAFMLSGKLEQAIGAFRTFVQMRPQNPLGHLELGFAYEAQCP